MINSHKDLKVWQESLLFVKDIYALTSNFPKEEQFGLTNQMRRAAVSIPSNIAEGAGRNGKKEWIRFLYIALGSISELETQLEIAKILAFVSESDHEAKRLTYIRRMIIKLISSLNS